MFLHFDRLGVQRLLKHAEEAPHHLPSFRERKPIRPALWLVGDEGVYLRSNGSPADWVEPDNPGKCFVVYAAEIDPTRMPFDAWWAAKRRMFGGDDEVIPLLASDIEAALATYRPGDPLIINVMPEKVAVVGYEIDPANDNPANDKGGPS